MREIKFRQAIYKDGVFHHWHYWGFCGYRGDFVAPIRIKPMGDAIDPTGYEVKESQEFIGLKDKNGNEIYEGDIVSFALPNNLWSDGHEVKFHRGSFVTKSGGVFSLGFLTKFENLELLEVIGNISENPELLEVNNDRT